jgi:branched-chain amino acid transport system permease protein
VFWQFLINGTITGLSYVPVACGLTLIYSVTGVFNFAHGVSYVIAGSLAFLLISTLGLHPGISLVLTSAITGLLGVNAWRFGFKRLQERGASAMSLMIASIALLILTQNLWLLLNGNDRVFLSYEFLDQNIARLSPLSLSAAQLLIVPTVLGSLAAVETFLRRTNLGCSLRAVSSNRSLAEEQGFNLPIIYGVAFAIGGVLASLSSYCDLFDSGVGIDPIRNLRIVLVATIASLIGGAHQLISTAIACVLIGIARSLSTWLAPQNWGDAVTAALLIAFICARTVGISGRRLWKEAV